jgi:hypothetical protein
MLANVEILSGDRTLACGSLSSRTLTRRSFVVAMRSSGRGRFAERALSKNSVITASMAFTGSNRDVICGRERIKTMTSDAV